MFELIIKRKDGSVYWDQYFNSAQEANQWLGTEESRPYWDKSYSVEVIDNSPPPPSQDDLDKIAKKKSDIQSEQKWLKAMCEKQDLSSDEVKQCMIHLLKFNQLRGEL